MFTIFSFVLLLAAVPTSFAESNSKSEEIPTFSSFPEPAIISTEKIDGTVVNIYSDLPEEFILLNEPANSQNGIGLLCATCYTYKYTKISGPTMVYSDTSLGWHPSFGKFNNVDAYTFGNTSVTFSFGLAVGYVSVSVSEAASTGTIVNAYGNKMTRPRVQGEVYKAEYKVEKILNGTGRVESTYNETRYTSQRTYVRIMNEDGTCNNKCSKP